MRHRVRHLLRRSANIAPVRRRRVRQLLREGDLEENKMSRSPTLRRAKPLTRNSSDGTSSTDGEAETKRKQIRLEQSARGRARAIAKAGEDPTLGNLSFLERVSVSHGTEAKYRTRVEQFLSFADEEKLALVADDEVDAAIVQYLNMSYSQGRPVSDGEVLLAGLLFFQPQYGKLGRQKLGLSWRALKGSDTIKTTTTKNDLVRGLLGDGEKQETFDGHPRPDDGRDVLPTWRTLAVDARGPMHGDWSLLLHSVRRGAPSKPQSYDDTIDLGNQIYPGSPKWLQSWRPAFPPRRSPSTDTNTSPRSFEEQHVHRGLRTSFRTSTATLERH